MSPMMGINESKVSATGLSYFFSKGKSSLVCISSGTYILYEYYEGITE